MTFDGIGEVGVQVGEPFYCAMKDTEVEDYESKTE